MLLGWTAVKAKDSALQPTDQLQHTRLQSLFACPERKAIISIPPFISSNLLRDLVVLVSRLSCKVTYLDARPQLYERICPFISFKFHAANLYLPVRCLLYVLCRHLSFTAPRDASRSCSSHGNLLSWLIFLRIIFIISASRVSILI